MNFSQRIYLGFEKQTWPASVAQKLPVINADAVRRALDKHPHVVLYSADGRRPFGAYSDSDSLDDFLDHAMLDLYDLLRAETSSHSQTARQLRIDRTSLYQRLERARRRLCLATVK